MSDQAAFQEIDDAVRQDDMKAWWARWGTAVVAGVVVLIVAVVTVVVGLGCMFAMERYRPAFFRGETMHTGLSITDDDQVVHLDGEPPAP